MRERRVHCAALVGDTFDPASRHQLRLPRRLGSIRFAQGAYGCSTAPAPALLRDLSTRASGALLLRPDGLPVGSWRAAKNLSEVSFAAA
jgi:hypothetical protein